MSADAPLEETDANPMSRRNWGHALRAIAYLAFGMVVVLLIAAVVTMPEDVGFELRGTVVPGKVTQVETHDEGRHDEQRVSYSFEDREGSSHTGSTRVVLDETAKRYRPGDKIEVQYRTADPSGHRATRDSKLRSRITFSIDRSSASGRSGSNVRTARRIAGASEAGSPAVRATTVNPR